MADPFAPQNPPRNYLDDLIEQAQQDLELERQRQEAIITSEEPDKVLGSINKVEKQIENESPEVQKSVRQKAYQPGYFDLSRTIDTMAVSKPKEKDNKAIDEMFDDYFKYQEKFPIYYEEIFNQLLKEKLGTVKEPARTTTMKGERWSYPKIMYGEEHLEVEARKLAKERLAQEGLIKPAKTGLGTLKEIVSDPKEFARRLPFIGGGIETQEALELLSAIKDAKNGTADEEDYQLLIEAQMEAEREGNFGALVAEIATQLPAYAIEFSFTAGTASAGKEAVKRSAREAVNWMLKKQGKEIIKEGAEKFGLRAVQGAVGTTAGAFARTLDPRMLPRIMSNTSKQLLPDFEINKRFDDQIEVVSEEIKPFGKALSEGFMLTFTENLGEQFGDTFGFAGKELTKFVNTNPKSVVSGIIKAIVRKNPKVPPGKIMQGVRQAGIHSVPVEIFEERVTDFLQSGIEGHEFKWPTPEEWLAEIVAIGGFAGSAGAIGSAVDYRTRKKQEKAKTKGLEAIETGQLRQLSDQDIADFVRSLTPEERMEVGIGEDGQFEVESDLGKEVVRRNLDMDKFPETEKEIREANARLNVKERQLEGTDFTGALISKVEELTNIKVEREYLGKTLADEIEERGWTEEETKQVLKEHGLDENSDPSKVDITGTSFGGSIRISTAGTENRMAQEYVAVQEEMAEEYYKAEQQNNSNFDNEIEQERKAYHEATGEQDTGESNLEWFSTKAIHFATQGKVHESIGAKLRDIFKRFIDTSKQILKDAIKLRRAIKEGKVPESLVSKLKEATDFKTVGKKVKQAKKIKKLKPKNTFRISKNFNFQNLPTVPGYTLSGTSDFKAGTKIKSIVRGKDMINTSSNIPPDNAIYELKKINIKKDPIIFGDKTFSSVTRDDFLGDDYDGYQTRTFEDIKQRMEKGGMESMEPLIFDNFYHSDELEMIDGHHRAIIANELGWDEIYAYVRKPDQDSYRLSIAEGMKKHRTKPALRAPSKNEKLSKTQIKSRINRLKRDVIPEIEEFAKTNPEEYDEAIDWYFNDIRVAIDVLANEIPYVKDHPVLFTALVAITSNGQKVPGQYNDTADVINHFTENKSFPIVDSFTTGKIKKPIKVLKLNDGRQLGGARPGVIGQSVDRLKYIIDQFGVEGAEKWLIEPKSGIEIHEMAWASGTYKEGNKMDGVSVDQRKRDDKEYRGMHIFGRKIGNFGLAFSELNKDAVIDVWMSRWYNRHMGTPFNKDGDLQESPRNTSEWNLISQGVSDLTDEINKRYNKDYTVSQVQAVIWYHEKYYYEKNGINFNKGINYSRSANERAKQKGYFKDTEELVSVSDVKGKEQERSGKDKKRVSKEKPSYRLTPTFYSQAERVVTDKFPPTMKSQSVENFLKKNLVKPEEIEWLDLESLLKGKLKITKEELQEWIQANKIEIKDVTLGESYTLDEEKSLSKDEFIKMFEQPDPAYPDETPGNALDDGETIEFVEDGTYSDFKYYKNEDKEYISYKDEMEWKEGGNITVQRIDTDEWMGNKSLSGILERGVATEDDVKQIIGSMSSEATRHSTYQLPGEKEDYRELLLTLPSKNLYNIIDEYGTVKQRNLPDEESLAIAMGSDDLARVPVGREKDTFNTSHFKQSNILAHVRFNTRISPTGERILFIEELQSDWHKKGREKGYKENLTELPEGYTVKKWEVSRDEKMFEKANFSDRVNDNFSKTKNRYQVKNPSGGSAGGVFTTEESAIKNALGNLNANKVPNAPFKGNGWIELIMKRMLRHASDNNFDRIAWTTFNQQIDRWRRDIRQNVDQIQWQKNNKESNVIINGLKNKENKFNQTIPLEGETTINGQRVTLEGLLGKQMATQIRNSNKRTGIIEGDDLTIGGQGFKVVYDFAISKILNKMGKKFGAKVDQVTLKTEIVEGFEEAGFAGRYQPSIKITRKMKESALKGQPTFRASKMSSTDEVLESSSFKKWFKGSKVVDEQGKPLVVYHGTNVSFNKFDIEDADEQIGNLFSDPIQKEFSFTDNPKVSDGYANSMEWLGWNPQVFPVYLKLENPAIYDVKGKNWGKFKIWNGRKDVGVLELANLHREGESFDDKRNPGKKINFKKTDGVIFKNINELGSGKNSKTLGTTYQVFEPTQIKSVFNKGTFNPNDPRISFRLSPKSIVTPLAKVYQEQKGNKKSYTKKDWEQDLARLGYDEDMIKSAMDMFGIIRMKQIDTTDPTPIEKELKKLQEREIKKSEIKSRIKRAYRLGATEKEKEITKLQKIVTNYARQNLPKGLYQKSEVTGILAKVRDAKRFRELSTAMERIDRVIDKVSKRGALAKWNKTIKKKATVKKVGGIGRGKVGADVQEIVNQIRDIHKKSPVEIENKIDVLTQIMEASEDGEATDSQALEINILLQYGSMKNKTPQEIIEAIEKFDTLVTQGRMQIMEEQMAYSERMSNVRQEILDVITGGAGAQTQAGAQKLGLKDQGIIKEIVESLSGFETQQQSLEYLFDKLSRLDKTSKPLQSFINNYFMPQIRQARLAEYNGVVEMHKLMRENAERIFKVKDTIFNKALTKLFNRNSIETITITHRDGAEGEMTSSDLTYNQAYKKWMELKDPTLHKTFEKMGWDIPKAITQIEQQLPKEVLAWAEWQLYEFYPMYYHRVNETFRSRFYVNMPMNAMYSPIARRIGAKADEGDDTLNKSKSPMGSMSSAGSLKGRVSNTEELAWIDGDNTLMKHITEMEHFIHYTNVMRELRSVFMSRDVSRSVQDFHGKNISRTLNKFMDDIARGGVDRAMHLEWADKWRAKVTRATIGLNEVVFIKQLTSIPAYWGDMPIISWNKEVLMSIGAFEFKKAYRTLSKSDMIKMRYDKGFERDMVLALNNIKPGKMMTGSDWLNNVAFFLTKMGDKTAIFLGGWPLYKYEYKKALKEGKTKKEAEDIAMKKFEASTLRAQQASDVEDLSDFQRMGSAWKFFTMYMTSPNQYYRMSAGGVRNIYYGRGTKAENLRRIFVGWFLLPQLFTFVANGFEIDEDEQLISLLTGPFVGLMFVGQGIEHSIRMAFGKEYRSGSVALLDIFNDFGRMFKKMFNGKEFETKKILSIIDDFLKGSSKAPLVGGFPYAPVKRSITSKIKVIKGESDNPIREAVGFKFKKKKKKQDKKKKKNKVKQLF